MDLLLSAFRDGGPFMYLILMASMVAFALPVGCTILQGLGNRLAAPAWLVGPVGLVALGALGSLSGLVQAERALGVADDEYRAVMAASGIAVALYTTTFSQLAAWFVAGFSAFGAALAGLIGARGEGTWSLGPAIATAAVGTLASGLYLVLAWPELRVSALYPASSALFGSWCVAALAARRPADEAAAVRTRGVHGVAAALVLLSVLAGVGLTQTSTTITGFKALATVAPEAKGVMLEAVLELVRQGRLLGFLPVVAALVGLGLAGARLRDGLDRYGAVSAALAVALFALAPVAWWTVNARTDALWDEFGDSDVMNPAPTPPPVERERR